MGWKVDFFEDGDGNVPVEEFLSALTKKKQGKVLQFLTMLEEYGPTLPFPYSSQVEGKLRELRAHYGNEQYRILYYGDANQTFVLLHAFIKRSDKLPKRDMNIGLERMKQDMHKKGEPK